jgi:hypothetical protein
MLAGCGTVLTQLGVTTGWAVVSWTRPNSTANGTALTDLAGYELFYGRNPSELIHIVKIPDVRVTRMIVRGLDSGTWYFVVTAYTRSGAMSVPSNVASKTIP